MRALLCICLAGMILRAHAADNNDVDAVNAVIADRALLSAMESLVVLNHLYVREVENLGGVISIYLEKHLTDIRKNQSAISDPEWKAAKIRVLNAIGLIWEKHPPEIIKIEGNEDKKALFYTSMYRLFIQPNNIADVGEIPFYSTLSLWDTYRAAHPLYTIVSPEKVDAFVNSMVNFTIGELVEI